MKTYYAIQTGPTGTVFETKFRDGLHILHDNGGDPMLFDSEEEAEEYIAENCPEGMVACVLKLPPVSRKQ